MNKIYLSKKTKIAVVGDIHEHQEQFDEIIEKIKPSKDMIFVSVGDIYHRGMGKKSAEYIINKIKNLNEKGYAFVVKGNHELKEFKKSIKENKITKELEWISTQPLYLNFEFKNKYNITVIHGGVAPVHNSWDSLNLKDVCYVRNIDEKGKPISLKRKNNNDINFVQTGINWHDIYDGRFGYIASGHQAQLDGVPKFYKNSCNLDSGCYATGKLSCQIFSKDGLEELIIINGKSYYNLNEEINK